MSLEDFPGGGGGGEKLRTQLISASWSWSLAELGNITIPKCCDWSIERNGAPPLDVFDFFPYLSKMANILRLYSP